MNNNRLTASKSKAALEEQSYDLIQQHIIDPENSPLPEHLRVQCNRVLQIARLWMTIRTRATSSTSCWQNTVSRVPR